MSDWISTNKELPEPETYVLGIVEGFDGVLRLVRLWETCDPFNESYFEDFLYWDWVDNDGQDLEGKVRYWMPLPQLPNVEISGETS